MAARATFSPHPLGHIPASVGNRLSMSFVSTPEPRTVEEKDERAPSRPLAWTFVGIVIVGFAIGGLGLVFWDYFWLVYAGFGVVVVGGIFGWLINIMEFTEEETRMSEAGGVQRVEPATEPGHG